MAESVADKKWCRVSFRLMGNSLDVDEASSLLGVGPSSTTRIGDETRFGEKLKTNVWVYAIDGKGGESLEPKLRNILQVLETKADAILELLAIEGVEGQLFVGLGSPDAIHLPHDLLSRIGKLGLSIDVDLY